MNEKLKFSWGHIIAFLAIIFIGYLTFVGLTYRTDGNFILSLIGMLGIVLLLMFVFIGAQQLKGTERKFAKRIVRERILVFASPLVFVVLMLPYLHFWTVHSKEKVIVTKFSDALQASTGMFDDYEAYANARINNYSAMLDSVPNAFEGATPATQQKENYVRTLRLKLLSSNYEALNKVAKDWIAGSSEASTWNVFLLGNVRAIDNTIGDWEKELQAMSAGKLSNEELGGNMVAEFTQTSGNITKAREGLNSLHAIYTRNGAPTAIGLITLVVLYLALLFPYILQDRWDKSIFTLTGQKRHTAGPAAEGAYSSFDSSNDVDPSVYAPSKKKKGKNTPSADTDGYDSFTL